MGVFNIPISEMHSFKQKKNKDIEDLNNIINNLDPNSYILCNFGPIIKKNI